MEAQVLCGDVLKEAERLGVDDASIIVSVESSKMVRFSNNAVTVVKVIRNISVEAYVARAAKRAIGSTMNPKLEEIKIFLKNLVGSLSSLNRSRDYAPLPQAPFEYAKHSNFDPAVDQDPQRPVMLAKECIDTCVDEGGRRVAGSLMAKSLRTFMKTSGGAEAEDRNTTLNLNVRVFSDSDSSGHGLACSTKLADFDVRDAARTAAKYARESANPRGFEEGTYDVLMTPTVAADIIQHVGSAASAYSVDLGLSFLTGKMGEAVAAESFTLRDSGLVDNGLSCSIFDSEGTPTRETTIIEKGVLRSYLHNSTTAKKFSAESTGNAGIISPHPWNLVVAEGDYQVEEMIRGMKRGLVVTNNWYMRFQNLRGGEYSTLPRDASFLVENGEFKYPVVGLRISDAIPRQLLNIAAISKERKWIEWWEVGIPTLTPWILIKDVPITKAVGS